jgi:hypothetical protein
MPQRRLSTCSIIVAWSLHGTVLHLFGFLAPLMLLSTLVAQILDNTLNDFVEVLGVLKEQLVTRLWDDVQFCGNLHPRNDRLLREKLERVGEQQPSRCTRCFFRPCLKWAAAHAFRSPNRSAQFIELGSSNLPGHAYDPSSRGNHLQV